MLFVEVSNLMASDVLGSGGTVVYGCVYVYNSYGVLKRFLKHGVHLLLNLRVVLISLCQTATGINLVFVITEIRLRCRKGIDV